MPTNTDIPELASPAAAAAKAIHDLSAVVMALQGSLPLSKPWQRYLVAQLDEAARHLDVLRLTISLDREDQEVAQAAGALHTVLRRAYQYISSGRADDGTRTAMRLALELARRVERSLADMIPRAG